MNTQALRDGIRSGSIHCGCRIAGNVPLTVQFDYHFSNCPWRLAIDQIYTCERAAEGDASNNPINEESRQ